MFDQPCQRGHLPLNPETLTIGNKPVTISGDPSKQPNDNIKTKLKNNSTTTTQEACGRASTTFTFMHLADAFIQSDLHCMQVTVFTFDQLLLSLGIEPMMLALLVPCSTS